MQKCRDWVEAGGLTTSRDAIDEYLWDFAEREGHKLNMTDCLELERHIDPHCAFDADQVRNFTRDVVKNGGSYTIAFWVEPLPTFSRILPHFPISA